MGSAKAKILLVDDTETILLFLKTILTGYRFEFVTARNGVEAITVARAEKPDLILLDVIMPVMDGFEACRVIKGDPELKATPVIVVTTRSGAENLDRVRTAGADDVIFKPIRKLELLDKINRWLPRRD